MYMQTQEHSKRARRASRATSRGNVESAGGTAVPSESRVKGRQEACIEVSILVPVISLTRGLTILGLLRADQETCQLRRDNLKVTTGGDNTNTSTLVQLEGLHSRSLSL